MEKEADLIHWARRLVAADMGLKDDTLLDDSFTFVGPFDGPIGKKQFLDGSRRFNLRGAFPDFQFNAHDFMVDKVQPRRVWFVTRKSGTHTGDLPMYDKIIYPTGRCLDLPPESYSCTFNEQGRCTKLTGGFVIDAQQGSSGGLGGPLGIAKCVGCPRSRLSHEPPIRTLKSLLMAPLRKFQGKETLLEAYVPSAVPLLGQEELLEAAKNLFLKQDSGLSNPDMLSEDFTFFDPLVGAVDKGTYLYKYRDLNVQGAFPDLVVNDYNWRIDPYAPCTVWCTVRYTGTHNGTPLGTGPLAISSTCRRYESAPEAVSLTFNADKLCCRMTVGAVLDREEGNTGGLGGIHGIRYALGHPTLPLLTRPLRFQSKAEWGQAVKGMGTDLMDKLWQSKKVMSPSRTPKAAVSPQRKPRKPGTPKEEKTLWDLVHDPLVVTTE